MAPALRTLASKLRERLSSLLARLDKPLCWLFGHADTVVKTEQHALACLCFDGGGHGRVYRACTRCRREFSRIELIC